MGHKDINSFIENYILKLAQHVKIFKCQIKSPKKNFGKLLKGIYKI